MLDRWQGLRIMLKMPHTKDAASAIAGAPSTACESLMKSCSISRGVRAASTRSAVYLAGLMNDTPSSFHFPEDVFLGNEAFVPE